jgi:hypothetical protein
VRRSKVRISASLPPWVGLFVSATRQRVVDLSMRTPCRMFRH